MRYALIAAIVGLGLLAGCAAKYEGKTDYQLCYSKATITKVGPAARVRQAEIESRGLNCRKYAKRINQEIAAEREARAGAPRSSSSIYNPPVYNPVTPARNTSHCRVSSSGRRVTCY